MSDYDAILLDLDGTLVDDRGGIHPTTLDALREAAARGIVVMVVTGRSETGAEPVLQALGLDGPASVYNGAGLWCPRTRRLLEERVLSNRSVARTLELAEREGILPVVMRSGEKHARKPRNDGEVEALNGLTCLHQDEVARLPREYVIRITLLSDRHGSSRALAERVQAEVDQPLYVTHFPLSHLAEHRGSRYQAVDLQPPCRGKAEALRVLQELRGIPAERVVAVGDATNDIPMFEAAGLAVAMEGSMPAAAAAADRVIGRNDSDAIARLVRELFG